MKFAIKHEIKGRMRIHVAQYRMSCAQADTLLYFLQMIYRSQAQRCMSVRVTQSSVMTAAERN